MAGVSARILLSASLASAFIIGLTFGCYGHHSNAAPPISADQGCVNQGRDHRIAGTFICWAQRHLSWKSDHEPDFVLLGNSNRTSLGFAWPPYLVYNSSAGEGRWRMFRIGFRYDRSWRGYIFPTVAWKVLAKPLRY